MAQRDWNDAFANMAHIAGAQDLPAQWAEDAARWRARNRVETGIAYGAAARERMDIVWPDGTPDGTPCGLMVFVHGGYWMATGISDWTHYAEGALARGWAVCLPDYTLAPEARIAQMTQQIGQAVQAAAARVAGPIRLAGHSAGGHLACRMICQDSPLPAAVLGRIARTVSISGLHDLRPLIETDMNATLRLDEAEARAESPALLRPHAGQRVTAWVGGDERPEFLRQTRLIEAMWSGLGAEITARVEPGRHHFSVLDGLRNGDSPLVRALMA